MKIAHNTSERTPDFNLKLDNDGTWSRELIRVALLADIRRSTEAQLEVAREQLRVTRRIDRRLAKRVKLR